jgi:ankyrin repeat protein
MLHAAVYKDLPDMLRLLLVNDSIDINAVDLNGRTSVDYCAYYGRASSLEALLLDPRTDLSSSSLLYAACRGHWACFRLFFDTNEKGNALIAKTFYEQILGDNASLPWNRRAILIAAKNGFFESYQSLLLAVGKAAVDAERPSWRGFQRTSPNK